MSKMTESGFLGALGSAYKKIDHLSKAVTVATGLTMPIDVPKFTTPDALPSQTETVGGPPAKEAKPEFETSPQTLGQHTALEKNIVYHQFLDKLKIGEARAKIEQALNNQNLES